MYDLMIIGCPSAIKPRPETNWVFPTKIGHQKMKFKKNKMWSELNEILPQYSLMVALPEYKKIRADFTSVLCVNKGDNC